MPLAIEQLDLSGYDLVVSSSSSVAKGVLTGPDQIHIAYVHSPMRYAWDLQHQYLRETATERGLKSLFVRWMLHRVFPNEFAIRVIALDLPEYQRNNWWHTRGVDAFKIEFIKYVYYLIRY